LVAATLVLGAAGLAAAAALAFAAGLVATLRAGFLTDTVFAGAAGAAAGAGAAVGVVDAFFSVEVMCKFLVKIETVYTVYTV
jgi:hypothetical protein